ncbi:MAG: hypothetical protein PHN60_03415 [Candidatus Gracilibacteria bacterium]|nr:hypothetical protein [Candidatus Gracilibacteria bacterium]
MATFTQNDIIKEYSIGILKMKFEYRKKEGNLLENLGKYMIKTGGNKKEDLSSTIDATLYGKK